MPKSVQTVALLVVVDGPEEISFMQISLKNGYRI